MIRIYETLGYKGFGKLHYSGSAITAHIVQLHSKPAIIFGGISYDPGSSSILGSPLVLLLYLQ